MRCPGCGDENAYMGFSSIDCPNSACRHYQGPAANPTTNVPMPAPTTGSPGNVATTGAIGSTGPANIATLSYVWVDITSVVPKKSSVLLSFTVHGDPQGPPKRVEFLWSLPGQNVSHICSLSSPPGYHVAGVAADGMTVYNTHWRCNLDGVKPTDNFMIDARVM
jgi:hypothetical protein